MTRRVLRDIETHRLVLPDNDGQPSGDWVEIKSKFTMGDRAAINEGVVGGGITTRRVSDDEGKEDTITELGKLTLGRSNIVTLLRAIVTWGGPGFCVHDHDSDGTQHFDDDENNGCRPVVINERSIMSLDDSTGRFILTEVERRNPQPKEASTNP